MLVFVDMTSLARTPTGIEVYTLNLVKAIISLDNTNTYHLLFRIRIHPEFSALASDTCICTVSPFASQLLTEQIFVPFIIFRRRFDAHFFPCFPPGLFVSKSNLLVVCYDATMWLFPKTLSLKNRLYFKPLTVRALKYAKKVFTISDSSLSGLVGLFPRQKSRIVNIGAALPEGLEPVAAETAQSKIVQMGIERDFVLMVGSLEPRKNIPFALQALGSILKSRNLQLVLVGRNAWGTDGISETIVNEGLSSYVIRTGFVSQYQLRCLYSAAKVFVFPSIYEGFGFPVLEAFSCGCPVVASNCSSISEVAGDAALLFDVENSGSLCSAVEQLLDSTDQRDLLQRKGFLQLKKFGWAECAERFIRAINS